MISDTPTARLPAPGLLESVGRQSLGVAGYLGGLTMLVGRAFLDLLPRRSATFALYPAVTAELAWMFAMGLPLVGLIHIGIGSFLSMQAYYGGTFVEGTGAVVGVGLFRNVAPMMAGLTVAALFCARITPELRLSRLPTIAAELGLPDRGQDSDQNRRVAAILAAGMVCGFILTFWACLVGTVVGWRVAANLMGVSTHSFFVMFKDMIWVDDIVGALLKGLINGAIAACIACHEGLRAIDDSKPGALANAAFRATCLAWIAVLLVNSAWFLIFYHAGSAFGPTLMAAPNS